ncbi:MAG: response regulator [Hyphomicrobiaceae bacterium]|nr:response regulator [Hyphomicrobiaceae bacterium]
MMPQAPHTGSANAGSAAVIASGALIARQRPRILVVEDETLVALDLAQQLECAGFEVIGPAASVAQARTLMQEDDCDAAVLDVNLGRGETSEPVAQDLVGNGIPIIVVSGYARSQHPAVFQGMSMLVKPVRIDTLVAELKRVLQQP